MDGKVIIGTALDTKDLEKDLKNAERQLTQYEKEAERLTKTKAKYETSDNWRQYASEKQVIEETIQSINNSTKSEAQKKLEILAETQMLQELNGKYEKQVNAHNEILEKIQANAREQEVLKDKVKQTTEEYQRQKGFANIKDILKDVSKETNSVVNKVGRWALAVFGVRSAYMFIRQAMSTLSQYDDQMATNIEYIRYLLASALKPLIETLINLAYQLLQYLNMIMQSWFGINLFANATTEEFMKQKNAMGGTSKAAKELQKTLAGFDEMNILQKDGSTSSGGGGGGITMPKFPKMDEKRPEWMQWIIDHKDEIIAALSGITAGLIALKGASMLKSAGIIESFPISKLVGIALVVSGLVYAFESFSKFDKDGTLQSLGKGIEGVGTAVVGAALVFSSLFTGIIGGVAISYGAIIKYWDDIKKLGEEIVGWLQDKSDWVHKTFGDTIGLVYDIFVENLGLILKTLDKSIEDVRIIFKNVIKFVKDVFKGDWKAAWEDIKKIFSAVWDNMVTKIKGVWQIIKNTVAGMVIAIGDNIKWNIKIAINSVINSIERMINLPANAINSIIGIANGLGAHIRELPTVQFPRLAKGGIVNMPGRGVPVGSAIAGERGAEGVIPLTDSQQMALLGEAIGKYITINANITNTMNGRVISKELQKIQAENDFAFNK